ncbi:MAG TPA: sulfotransferase [Candidatus Binataceae bacterium]|nr:sulfotransferase [Candidatus Binataceae bacterium]
MTSSAHANNGRGRLPDFLGVGQPRTGTSWLDSMLRGHAGLPRDVKEVDFFVKNYARGIEWYKGYFAGCDPRLPAGEICPSYLGSNAARERIAEHIPECRIICTLRDPVQVLFSFWKLARRNAWTAHDFETYTPDGWETDSKGLRAWFETFGREQVLALLYDDLEAAPQDYLDRVCDFIGIEHIAIAGSAPEAPRVNSFSRMPRSAYLARKARKLRDRLQSREYYRTINLLTRAGVWRFCFDGGAEFPPLDPATERRIRRRLMPQVEDLETLLDRDLSAWKASPDPLERGVDRASA